jgi:dipeptide/tripeptide permease
MVNIIQSVMMADQFHGHPAKVIDSSFSTFYFWSNVGSMVGESVGPILRQYSTWEITTTLLLGSVVVAALSLIIGSPSFRKVVPRASRQEERVRARVIGISMPRLLWRDTVDDARSVFPLLLMFAPLPVFWALFYQQNSTWVFQAQRMDRYLGMWGETRVVIPPDLMPSLEDVVCLIMIFFFDKLIYTALNRCGVPATPLRKIGAGIVCVGASFGLSGLLEIAIRVSPPKSVNVAWQVPQIFLMGCGEVLVAIAGLDFAYTQAMERTRGVVNSFWGLSQAVGQVLVIAVFSFVPTTDKTMVFVFFGFAAACLLTVLVFGALARRYHYLDPADLERRSSAAAGDGLDGDNRQFADANFGRFDHYGRVESPSVDVGGINRDAPRRDDERNPLDSGKFSLSTSDPSILYEHPRARRLRQERESARIAQIEATRGQNSEGDDRDSTIAATPPRNRGDGHG